MSIESTKLLIKINVWLASYHMATGETPDPETFEGSTQQLLMDVKKYLTFEMSTQQLLMDVKKYLTTECSHQFKVNPESRFKKCIKCSIIKKDI